MTNTNHHHRRTRDTGTGEAGALYRCTEPSPTPSTQAVRSHCCTVLCCQWPEHPLFCLGFVALQLGLDLGSLCWSLFASIVFVEDRCEKLLAKVFPEGDLHNHIFTCFCWLWWLRLAIRCCCRGGGKLWLRRLLFLLLLPVLLPLLEVVDGLVECGFDGLLDLLRGGCSCQVFVELSEDVLQALCCLCGLGRRGRCGSRGSQASCFRLGVVVPLLLGFDFLLCFFSCLLCLLFCCLLLLEQKLGSVQGLFGCLLCLVGFFGQLPSGFGSILALLDRVELFLCPVKLALAVGFVLLGGGFGKPPLGPGDFSS